MIGQEDNSQQLRILRLKHYIDADAKCPTIDTILDALENCTTVRSCRPAQMISLCVRASRCSSSNMLNGKVEALYIHNFEEGMQDAQLAHLSRVLQKGYIWALNVGENFKLSPQAWSAFADSLT